MSVIKIKCIHESSPDARSTVETALRQRKVNERGFQRNFLFFFYFVEIHEISGERNARTSDCIELCAKSGREDDRARETLKGIRVSRLGGGDRLR